LLTEAVRLANDPQAEIILLHVVESPAARILGTDAADRETKSDQSLLEAFAEQLRQSGINASWRSAAGEPSDELARMVNELQVELVILGGHGHAGVSDLLHGTTVGHLRHLVRANVLVVPLESPPSLEESTTVVKSEAQKI
jgi:manganese transport protein